MTTTPLQKSPFIATQSHARLSIAWQYHARTLFAAIALFIVFALLFAVVQFVTPALAGNDGYYHMRMGELMREYGLRVPFVWLPMSIIAPDSFYDHHLLYHAYLSLFAGDGSIAALNLGAKIASVVMPSLAFIAIWWLLRGQRVRWAALWALALFAVSEAFLYRMSMPRAQSASLLMLALGLHWLLQRRYVLLVPLGFLYVWLYNAFPLLMVLGGITFAATCITERRVEWRTLLYPAIGIALGLLINPYFPQNLTFISNHLLPKVGESATSVGNEWYPYETWTLIENSGFALGAFVLGVFALGWRGTRFDRSTLVAFVLAVLFGFMLFKSRRFIEYFPAFVVIFAALSFKPLLEHIRSTRLVPTAILIALIVPLLLTLDLARDAVAGSKPADQYAAAALWLKDNSAPGARVFQTDWDDFTRLFFYDTSNIFTIGLDPTYMQLYDPELYDQWVDLTRGKGADLGATIRTRFDAAYVFSDLNHDNFLDRAADDQSLQEVYRDNYAVIFKVLD